MNDGATRRAVFFFAGVGVTAALLLIVEALGRLL